MLSVPPGFQECLHDIHRSVDGVSGWLTDREIEFLALLAACPTTEGSIVELGSFTGRSTIVLAKAAALADQAIIHTVDIGPTDELEANLRRAGVRDRVEVYHMSSTEMLADWRRPVRFFWHDGANDIPTVTADVETAFPFLADRGFIAFHDVLNTSGDRIFVFTEQILKNPHFGAVGTCGSIAWAQYHDDPENAQAHRSKKQTLYKRLRRLHRFHAPSPRKSWLRRARYRLLRSMVPHGRVSPETFFRKIA